MSSMGLVGMDIRMMILFVLLSIFAVGIFVFMCTNYLIPALIKNKNEEEARRQDECRCLEELREKMKRQGENPSLEFERHIKEKCNKGGLF